MTNTPPEGQPNGSERGRDEQRGEETPRYHGGAWRDADHEPPPGTEVVRERSPAPGPSADRGGDRGGDRDGEDRGTGKE
jgi:hypothetical protein